MTPTVYYSNALYALATEIRNEEGCVTAAPELVEEAAERLDVQTVAIRVHQRELDRVTLDYFDCMAVAHRIALELECLLLDCKDTAAVSKWWDSAHDALDAWRQWCSAGNDGEPEKQPEIETAVPALVFYPAGSLGEEVA